MTSRVVDPVSGNDADLIVESTSERHTSISNPHPSIFVSEKILSAASARKALKPHWVSQIPGTAKCCTARLPARPVQRLYHGWGTASSAFGASLEFREAITRS